MSAPRPSLRYSAPGGVTGVDIPVESGSPRLFSVHKVSVADGWSPFHVVIEGPMLKKNGERGSHSRCVRVDLSEPLPEWLAEIVADARVRLGAA